MGRQIIYFALALVVIVGFFIFFAQAWENNPPEPICKNNWVCSNIGKCVNGTMKLYCVDTNNCSTGVPPATVPCVCQENWQCSAWVKHNEYTQATLDYFKEIALSEEYGGRNYLVKWLNNSKLTIKINGNPNSQDLTYLNKVVSELRDYSKLDIQYGETNANVNFYFVPTSEAKNYIPEYQEGNWGFVYILWSSKSIYDIKVFISTSEGMSQEERNHLIREEFTQGLGLLNDAWTYEDSTFYQGWTDTQDYSEIDKNIIRVLYEDKVKMFMESADIDDIFDEEIRTCVDTNECGTTTNKPPIIRNNEISPNSLSIVGVPSKGSSSGS